MATEASAADQTAEGHVEEVKVINDVKDIDKECCPESKHLEGKDDEEIRVEDSTGAAAPAIESETAVVSELKQEVNKIESAAEEVKNEETEVEKASDPFTVASIENEESSKQEVDSSTTELKEETDSAAVEPAVEADGKEPASHVEVTDTAEPPQPLTEVSTGNLEATLVQQLESETAKEPAVPEATADEANTTPETAAEEANTTPEAAAEEANPTSDTLAEEANQAYPTPKAAAEEADTSPEAAHVEVNTIEELPHVSFVSVTESKEEPPVVSPVTEPAPDDITIAGDSVTAETSKGESIKPDENTESQKEEAAAEQANTNPEAAAEEANTTTEAAAEQSNTTPEAAADESNTTLEAVATEELPQGSSVLVTESKEGESPVLSPVMEPTPDDMTIAGVSDTAKTSIGDTIKLEVNTETQKEEAATEEENITPEAVAEESYTTTEAAPVEVNTTEEFPLVSSVSVTESKEAEPPVVSPGTEPAPDDTTIAGVIDTAETSVDETVKLGENTESQKEEPLVTDSSKLEEAPDGPEAVVSESADTVATKAAPVEELKEGEEAAATEEVSNVPQLVEGDQNTSTSAEESVSLDASHVSEAIEISVKPDSKVEEMQEKAGVSEEPSNTTNTDASSQVPEVSSEGSGGVERVEEKEATTEGSIESLKDSDAAAEVPQVSSEGEKASEGGEEKMDGSLEGEKPTLVETSRDIDVEEAKNNVNAEADSLVSETTEKDEEKTPAESAKDAGEAPKAEVPTKSSQRNIFSKVKQSIVKVKKAIIGKSPSSKTISTESKDEDKVK